MNEATWLASDHPEPMLRLLSLRVSDRMLRLFGCACCRRVWSLLDNPCYVRAVEIAERYADGAATHEELKHAEDEVERVRINSRVGERANRAAHLVAGDSPAWAFAEAADAAYCEAWEAAVDAVMRRYEARDSGFDAWNDPMGAATEAAGRAASAAQQAARGAQAQLLRCITGNPFGLTAFDPGWLSWNGGTVPCLAQLAYEQRQLPSGHLEPARLAVLADALEEAGCTGAGLLGHLRGPGPHVRGCWVVDAILGKS
jgi:hypothetical protein